MSGSDELTADMRAVFGADVAWAMGGVEAERDWEKSRPEKFVQKVDPATGLRVWAVVVADPASQTQRKVKILCDDEPVVPDFFQGVHTPADQGQFAHVLGQQVGANAPNRACRADYGSSGAL